jgi:hypothetical protein
MARVITLAFMSAVLAGCSHRVLPSEEGDASRTDGGVATRTDRLRIRGTFCTGVEPGEVRTPVKILFVVDTSQTMGVVDPLDPATGKTRRRRAIELVVDRFANNSNMSFAIVSFNHKKEVLTKTAAGLDGFTRDVAALKAALAKLDAADGVTDIEGAWISAYKLLAADMARMRKADPYALQHSTYVVLFLADGLPSPQIQTAADWASIPGAIKKELVGPGPALPDKYNVPERIYQRVQEVMKLAPLLDVASLRAHAFFLGGGSNTGECRGGSCGYPGQLSATALLKKIADLGNGLFRSFTSAEMIDFLSVNYSSQGGGFPDLKSLVATNLSLRPTPSGPARDSDGDGLTDALERKLGTSVTLPDTDGDGWSDALEHLHKYDPLNPADADCPDPSAVHSDGDGLLDCEERLLGTHPLLADSDADGLDDWLELLGGTDPRTHDAASDLDHDGVTNGEELRGHTSPTRDEGASRAAEAYRYSITPIHSAIDEKCYEIEVENIQLDEGRNIIELRADQMLGKNPRDYGVFRAACVRASPGLTPLEVKLPLGAWQRLGRPLTCYSP